MSHDGPASKACLPPRETWLLAALPALLAVVQLGRLHPDEVYQFLEPAFGRAHGYGVLAWEWKVGLRNWAVPGLFAGLLWLCRAVGIDHPVAYRAVLEVPVFLLHLVALRAAYRYALRRVAPESARLALWSVGLTGAVLAFAGRTLGESLSGALLVLAFERLDREDRWGDLQGGLMFGLAAVVRYGSLPFIAAALAAVALRRRVRGLFWLGAGGLMIAACLGALDWLTWGRPFHSLVEYARFNVFSGDAAEQFGRSPPWFYAGPLLSFFPLWAPLGMAGLLRHRSHRRPAYALWGSAVYLGALLLTAHKEERFLYPAALVAWMDLGPAAAAWLLLRIPNGALRKGAVAAMLTASLATFPLQPDVRGDQFRAIVRATRAGARGLLIVNEGLWGAGGFFYIGKQIPWLTCDWPQDAAFVQAMRDMRFNRAVSFEGRAIDALEQAGFRTVERIGRATILSR